MKWKWLLLCFFVFQYLTACKGQDSKKLFFEKNASPAQSYQAAQQNFWDSLPRPVSWTNDFENIFTAKEKEQLDSIMAAFENETTVQFCIVTLDSFATSADQFNDLVLHIAKTWGVGQKDKNNGVVIGLSSLYKKSRICNGYGIEKILTDEETKNILDHFMISKYKEGKYFQGTLDGLMAMIEILRPRLKTEAAKQR